MSNELIQSNLVLVFGNAFPSELICDIDAFNSLIGTLHHCEGIKVLKTFFTLLLTLKLKVSTNIINCQCDTRI